MNTNDFRYQLRIKTAVLQAHVDALRAALDDIEFYEDAGSNINPDDFRLKQEAMFAKYWKIVSEIE